MASEFPITSLNRETIEAIENAEFLSLDSNFSQRKEEIYDLLARINGLGSGEALPTKAVALICGYSALLHSRFALIRHEPSYQIREKVEILAKAQDEILDQLGEEETTLYLLKTITLRVEHVGRHHHFLVCSIGDFMVDSHMKKELAPAVKRILKTETNVFNKGATVNPADFDPRLHLGVNPGIVSPFIDLVSRGSGYVSGLFYFDGMSLDGYVAIALSLTDTLVVKGDVFRGALNAWQERGVQVPFRAVGEFGPTNRPKTLELVRDL